ncbi:hypothetical protein K440DRAFT_611825 [Wilcoxina mikolae CBS 423.85]|nr:hypothetical protein K440DRAFT_611825 [Wilcoxina mikolae CBS 423.85]
MYLGSTYKNVLCKHQEGSDTWEVQEVGGCDDGGEGETGNGNGQGGDPKPTAEEGKGESGDGG